MEQVLTRLLRAVLLAATEEIRQLRAENSELTGQCVQLTTLLKDVGYCASLRCPFPVMRAA